MAVVNSTDFTKYEKARILGARALQIAMNAPLLIKINPEDLEKIKYDIYAIRRAVTAITNALQGS